MGNEIALLIVLLLFSGFFSSAETALFSISQTRARHLAKDDDKAFLLIKRMKEDPHKLLATILIGNNIVNVGASSLATSLALRFFQNNAVSIATGVMTFLILVFGEVFPKSIATRNNILIAKITILPVYWISILFYPVILLLNFIPHLTGKIKKTPTVTEEELKTFVDVVEEEGEIKEEEKELIHNIFEFDDTNAYEIMTPRADMFVIDVNKELDLTTIAETGFTRIPIIDGEIDNVIGILNIKDVFMHQTISNKKIDVRRLMSSPYFVPGNKKLNTLLSQFKKRKNHLAIIVDEHGGVSGLITLEDVLEELVGEISDETDKEEKYIVDIGPQEWIVLGKSDIEDVNEYIAMDIPDSKEYDTFSGYVLDIIGRIPNEKESFDIGKFKITVKKRDGNRINEYSVKRIEAAEENEEKGDSDEPPYGEK